MEEVVSGAAALIAFSAFFPAALSYFAPFLSPPVVQEAVSQASANRDPGLRLKLGCICRSPGRSTPFFQAVPRRNHRIYVYVKVFVPRWRSGGYP